MANTTTEKETFHNTFGEMKKYIMPDSLVAVMNIMFSSYMLGRNNAIEEMQMNGSQSANMSTTA